MSFETVGGGGVKLLSPEPHVHQPPLPRIGNYIHHMVPAHKPPAGVGPPITNRIRHSSSGWPDLKPQRSQQRAKEGVDLHAIATAAGTSPPRDSLLEQCREGYIDIGHGVGGIVQAQGLERDIAELVGDQLWKRGGGAGREVQMGEVGRELGGR